MERGEGGARGGGGGGGGRGGGWRGGCGETTRGGCAVGGGAREGGLRGRKPELRARSRGLARARRGRATTTRPRSGRGGCRRGCRGRWAGGWCPGEGRPRRGEELVGGGGRGGGAGGDRRRRALRGITARLARLLRRRRRGRVLRKREHGRDELGPALAARSNHRNTTLSWRRRARRRYYTGNIPPPRIRFAETFVFSSRLRLGLGHRSGFTSPRLPSSPRPFLRRRVRPRAGVWAASRFSPSRRPSPPPRAPTTSRYT